MARVAKSSNASRPPTRTNHLVSRAASPDLSEYSGGPLRALCTGARGISRCYTPSRRNSRKARRYTLLQHQRAAWPFLSSFQFNCPHRLNLVTRALGKVEREIPPVGRGFERVGQALERVRNAAQRVGAALERAGEAVRGFVEKAREVIRSREDRGYER